MNSLSSDAAALLSSSATQVLPVDGTLKNHSPIAFEGDCVTRIAEASSLTSNTTQLK
jgi:hypothetical protein